MRRKAYSIALLTMLTGCGGGGGSGSGAVPPPATPTPAIPILSLSGDQRQLLTVGQYGMADTPDEHLSLLQGSGTYRVWIAGEIDGHHGSAALLSTADGTTFSPAVESSGKATPVFGPPDPPQGDTFDSYYAAPGTVLQIDGSYVMIFHGEDHTWNGTTYPMTFYATVGLATSPDGIHWTTVGPIITARDRKPAQVPAGSQGAAVPSAIVAGNYVYAFYTDYPDPSSPDGNQPGLIQVARAPLAQVTKPSAWTKYYNGSFGQPAASYGNSSSIVALPTSSSAPERQAGISYNTYLRAYLLTFVCNQGWFYTTSQDLVHWSPAAQFFTAPFPNSKLQVGQEFDWYPTLFTPGEPSNQTTGKTGTVYYAKGLWETTSHELYAQSFSFAAAGAGRR
jgi:hypothetical protein